VGPRTCLEDMERRKFLPLPGLELRTLGRPASGQSLYRLRYQNITKKDCAVNLLKDITEDIFKLA
jgi:hypothetical protein